MVVKVNGQPITEAVDTNTPVGDVDAHASGECVSSPPPAPPASSPAKKARAKPKKYRRRYRQRGRSYDIEAVVASIRGRLEQGVTIGEALKADGMPSRSQFFQWLQDDPELKRWYEDTKRIQESAWEDKVVTLVADVTVGDIQITEVVSKKETNVQSNRMADRLAKAKAQADNLKWLLSRRDPARYAPQQIGISNSTTTNMHGNNTITVVNSPDIEDAVNSELAAQAADRNAVPVEDFTRKVSTNPGTDV
jgi:hypothetical protein